VKIKTGANQLHAWLNRHHRVSEASLAATFVEYQNEKWRYNTDEHVWLQWIETHWARRQTPEMLDKTREFAVLFTNALQKTTIISHAEAVRLQSQRAIGSIERLCRSLPPFLARTVLFDGDPYLLGTRAGTIDLRTGEMRAADPGDHITILATVVPAPPGTPCPRWQAFLDEVTGGNRDLQRTLQQWAGISASGTTRDQKLMFIYGPGRNGKGVFLRTIAGLLGEHAVNAPRDLFMAHSLGSQHPTVLVDVLAARMVMASEIPDGASWDATLIKDITGGDLIPVRRMRQDFYQAIPRCTVTISGNAKPELKTVDEAVRGRFLVVTFPVVIPIERQIADFDKVLISEEGPAILRWVIDGAVDRERSGRLHIAQSIVADTEDYFAEENLLEDFINTRFERAPPGTDEYNRNFWVPTSDAYVLWRGFCSGFGRDSGARNPFTTAMRNARIGYKRTIDGRFFTGIRKVLSGY
jgi:putative DNA primase/helicase